MYYNPTALWFLLVNHSSGAMYQQLSMPSPSPRCRELRRHLFVVEEKILESLAWEPASPLYNLIVQAAAAAAAPAAPLNNHGPSGVQVVAASAVAHPSQETPTPRFDAREGASSQGSAQWNPTSSSSSPHNHNQHHVRPGGVKFPDGGHDENDVMMMKGMMKGVIAATVCDALTRDEPPAPAAAAAAAAAGSAVPQQDLLPQPDCQSRPPVDVAGGVAVNDRPTAALLNVPSPKRSHGVSSMSSSVLCHGLASPSPMKKCELARVCLP